MATQKIQMPITIISEEKVAERAASSKNEKLMKEKFSEKEFPQEYERFNGFLKALDAENVKISITGKDGKVTEHSFSAQDAPAQAWRLLAAKEAGSLVKIEPESKEHAFITVSGLTESSLKAMKEDGYAPALVTETDAGRFQAVLKVRSGAEGERDEIQNTLINRYGNGKVEGITVPGFYGDSLNRIPRVVSCNEAAPVLGPGRIAEKLKEQAPAYAEHEKEMKAFAAEQPQAAQVAPTSKNESGEQDGGQKEQEQQAQKTQEAQGFSILNLLLAALKAFALILRDALIHAVSKVRVPGLGVQEQKTEPPFWRDKSQWSKTELEQRPEFSKEQKLAAEAPAQEQIKEVKTQTQEQTKKEEQTQEQTKAKKRGRSR